MFSRRGVCERLPVLELFEFVEKLDGNVAVSFLEDSVAALIQ